MAPLSAETPEPQEPESRYCKECKLAFTGGDQEKLLCSSCKNLRTKLWRRLGAWDTFKQLDAKDQELFFKKNAGTSDWPTIQSRLVETLTRVRVSESRSETGGSYLPASVLLTQGFTQDVIDACSDTEDNPALGGTTYRLRVHSEYSTEVERTVREEVLNRVKQVTTGKKTPKDWDVQRPEKAGKNDQGKEEDKAEKQKAKVAKAALALARSALPQVSAAWCSLQTAGGVEPGNEEHCSRALAEAPGVEAGLRAGPRQQGELPGLAAASFPQGRGNPPARLQLSS